MANREWFQPKILKRTERLKMYTNILWVDRAVSKAHEVADKSKQAEALGEVHKLQVRTNWQEINLTKTEGENMTMEQASYAHKFPYQG